MDLNGPYWAPFIPSQIEGGDGFNPVLEGFPLNLLFGGFTIDAQSGRLSSLDVCYEPAPETFRENSRRREMRYFTKPRNGYWIHVIFEKKTGE